MAFLFFGGDSAFHCVYFCCIFVALAMGTWAFDGGQAVVNREVADSVPAPGGRPSVSPPPATYSNLAFWKQEGGDSVSESCGAKRV